MREDWVEINYKEIVKKVTLTNKKIPQKKYLSLGNIPIIDQGQGFIGGYTNDEEKILDCKLPALVFGDHTKVVKLVNFPFASGADGTKVLESKNYLQPKLLKYFTQTLAFKIKDKGYARHYQDIEKSKIKIPPVLEQKAIVQKIEQLFSELDNGIENLKKAKEKLKIYRQAILKKAFEGELTKEWREKQKDLPTADKLLEEIKKERELFYQKQLDEWKEKVKEWEDNGKQGKKPTKPRKLKDINDINKKSLSVIPNNWIWLFSEDINDFITKGTTPPKSNSDSYKGNIPFLKVYNLTFDGSLDFNNNPTFINEETHKDFLQRSVLYPSDVVMNIVGPPLGKVSIIPNSYPEWNMNQAIVRFRPFNIIKSKYLANFLLLNNTIQKISKKAKATAGQFNLTLEICREIEIPLCSIEEQTQIVKEIESKLSVCDKIEQSIESNLKKSESLRQSILKKAFEGKLLSEDELKKIQEHPDYESAQKLLEKIKLKKSA